MKKQLMLFTAVLTAAGILAGCAGTSQKDKNQNEAGNQTENAADRGEAETGNGTGNTENQDGMQNDEAGLGYKMGLGVVSRMKRATNAGSTDGSAEIDTVIAAVSLDSEERIVGCTIDMIQHVIPVSNTGAIATPAQTEFSTKKELGDSYGMKAASDIGKEWYEQAQAFEQYAVGKTVDEINGIETDEGGYVQEDTLKASVSISISDFQAAVSKAVQNAY